MVLQFVDETNRLFHVEEKRTSNQPSDDEAAKAGPPPVKRSKLFAKYNSVSSAAANRVNPGSALMQINKYLDMPDDVPDDNCISFWHTHRLTLPKLMHPAARALSVPASSSPIERVFSHGGIILKPHRARMSDTMLSKLIFLKCNNRFNTQ